MWQCIANNKTEIKGMLKFASLLYSQQQLQQCLNLYYEPNSFLVITEFCADLAQFFPNKHLNIFVEMSVIGRNDVFNLIK